MTITKCKKTKRKQKNDYNILIYIREEGLYAKDNFIELYVSATLGKELHFY